MRTLLEHNTLFFCLALTSALLAVFSVLRSDKGPKAQMAWLGFVLLMPLLGPLLYYLIGINRIKRRVGKRFKGIRSAKDYSHPNCGDFLGAAWMGHIKLGESLGCSPLVELKNFEILQPHQMIYQRFLEAIDNSNHCIELVTYIFDRDEVGEQVCQALLRAHQRGVRVRVLIDGLGEHYAEDSAAAFLKGQGVEVSEFLPVSLFSSFRYLNLRNHRKLMIIDSQMVFTGGANLRLKKRQVDAVDLDDHDCHFGLSGPIVKYFSQVFQEDWSFAKREFSLQNLPVLGSNELSLDRPVGRLIIDGPDEDIETLPLMIQGALERATREIWIQTPYFLPDPGMVTELKIKALAGIRVVILIPETNNFPFLDWAAYELWRELIQAKVELYKIGPQFDHSKIFLVDDEYAMLGSANWDARSFRLNFELNLEVFDSEINFQLKRLLEVKIEGKEKMQFPQKQGLFQELRNRVFRLFIPYL